jgi:prepilin-type N-terminal cleavage/methylation domain-containing protein
MRRTSIVNSSGFTLVEFMVTVVLIVLLVAVALPVAGTMRESDRVEAILDAVARSRSAVRRHYADTGRLATECVLARHAAHHRLTQNVGEAGWHGPYLDPNLRPESLGATALEIRTDYSSGPCRPWGECFLIGGEQAIRLTGAGQYLALTGIDEDCARAVDRALDGQTGGDWQRDGEVQWRAAHQGTLMVLLMDI